MIELPPGDYADVLVAQLQAQGEAVAPEQLEALKVRFGFREPVHIRFLKWFGGVLTGDFGYSFEWNRSVNDLIGERLGLTIALSVFTLILTWIIALPVGIYSAIRKYTLGDYVVTFLNSIGLATPDFMIALILLWIAFSKFGITAVACSPQSIGMRPGTSVRHWIC